MKTAVYLAAFCALALSAALAEEAPICLRLGGGDVWTNPASATAKPLFAAGCPATLMSFNVRMGCGHDDPFRLPKGGLGYLPRCADIVRGARPDVVCVQEIDRNSARAGFMDQTAEFAKLCGMQGAWVEKIRDYGVAMLFRERPLRVRRVLIPGSVHTRALMVAEFPDCIVANSHFPLSDATCENAARIVREQLAGAEKPVFFLGDLNSRPESKAIASLKEDFEILSDSTRPTWPARKPDRTLDYVMVDKRHASSFRTLARDTQAFPKATDHCALTVTLVRSADTLAADGR